MSRRSRLFSLGIIPPLLTLLAFGLLVPAGTSAQTGDPTDEISDCELGLLKEVTPNRLLLGESATVSLVVEQTCPDYAVPIDLVFLVDTSNSMTRGRGGNSAAPPGGGTTPGDPGLPPPGPGDPPPSPKPLISGSITWQLSEQFGFLPNQDPPSPIPPPEPPAPGEPAPGVPSPGNPNDDPPGCTSNDAASPPGGSIDPPGGGPGPVVPPPAPGPGTAIPRKTEPAKTAPPPPPTPPSKASPTSPPGKETPGSPPAPDPGVDPDENGEPAGNEDLVRDAQKFIRDFFDDPQIKEDLANDRLRVGLVSFADRGRRLVSLTEKGTRVVSRLSLLRGTGRTRVDLGLAMAERTLIERSSYRTILKDRNRKKVVLLISDGGFCERNLRRGIDKDISIVTLAAGRGIYTRRMRDIATENEYVLDLNARALKEVMFIYNRDFRDVRPVSMTRLEMRDEPSDVVGFIPGSVAPPETGMDGATIRWNLSPPPEVFTRTYEIKPKAIGVHKVSAFSEIDWLDTEGRTAILDFPDIDVSVYDVEPPTPTDVPTAVPPTPTEPLPTPTNAVVELVPAYFPIALKEEEPPKCTPQQEKADIVLIVDTSTSMFDTTTPGGPRKIEAAISAGKNLADLLTLPGAADQDQAAVIAFNDSATTLLGMSTDRASIKSALDALIGTSAKGTRIDRGLAEGLTEMRAGGRTGTTKSIILVTDGKQVDEDGTSTAAVLATADDIKAGGIVLFTVGLGSDVDEDLLRDAATSPDHYKAAPDAAMLEAIYRVIARSIPCASD